MTSELAYEYVSPKNKIKSSRRGRRTSVGKINRKSFEKIDSATIASKLQLKEQQRELIYSCIYLFLKVGLLALFAGSFIRLGFASHQRIMRNLEISSLLELESKKLEKLNLRFDRLFTIGGQHRLISEQDHLIAPNSVRVIWK